MRFTWSLIALLGMPSLMMAQSYFIKGPEAPKPQEKTAIQEMTDYLARRIGDKTLSIGGAQDSRSFPEWRSSPAVWELPVL